MARTVDEVVIVGYGRAGRRHARLFAEAGALVVAMADPRGKERVRARRNGIAREACYWETERCLAARAEGRTVIVASPHKLHVQHAMAAIDAGCTALLVEKPLALDYEGAKAVVDAANTMGVRFATVCNWRFHPLFTPTMERRQHAPPSFFFWAALENPLRWTRNPLTRLRTRRVLSDPAGGGIAAWGAAHMIDLAIAMTGAPIESAALRTDILHVQNSMATVSFKAGETMSTITLSWNKSPGHSIFVAHWPPYEMTGGSLGTPNSPGWGAYASEMHRAHTKAFRQFAETGERGYLATPEQSVMAAAIIEALIKRARQ